MNYEDAIDILDTEASNMSGGANKAKLEAAMLVIEDGEATQEQKEDALNNINDVYWDATWSNQLEAGQAIFTISYTVDPSKPFPDKKS